MCGICGIVNFSATEPVDRRAARADDTMLRRIAGLTTRAISLRTMSAWVIGGLSIIDLSGGKQPIFNEDGSVVVVFNGEIYNYAD